MRRFYGCTALTSIRIPKSVQKIGEGLCSKVFFECYSLEKITVDNDNPFFDSREGCSGIIHSDSNTLLVVSKNTIIPNSVTDIGYYLHRYFKNDNEIKDFIDIIKTDDMHQFDNKAIWNVILDPESNVLQTRSITINQQMTWIPNVKHYYDDARLDYWFSYARHHHIYGY